MKKLFFFAFVCFSFLSAKAQAISFAPLKTKSLPTHVNAILKDSTGFIWLGAQDGLYRYDGYEMRRFGPIAQDTNSLSNAYIWCLHLDTKAQLWAGTFGGGLVRYNAQTENFQRFTLPGSTNGDQSVRSIQEDSQGRIWVGTEAGLWCLDAQNQTFSPISTEGTSNQQITNIKSIAVLDKLQLLIGAEEGLFRLSTTDFSLQNTNITQHPVSDIIVQKGNIWVGSHRGVLQLDSQLRLRQTHSLRNPISDHALANAVTKMWIDEKGVIWAGTLNGLFRKSIKNEITKWQDIYQDTRQPLPDQQVNAIVAIEPGLLWVATRQEVLCLDNSPPIFHTLNQSSYGEEICSDVILGSVEDQDGNWWLGTKDGLLKVNCSYQAERKIPDFDSFQCLQPAQLSGMPAPYVINMRCWEDELWATFWYDGLGKIIKNKDDQLSLSKIPGLKALTKAAGIHDILRDKNAQYWIATPNRGVVQWDAVRDSLIVHYNTDGNKKGLISPYIFYLLIDHQERLWAGTANGGLCYRDDSTQNFRCFLYDEANEYSLSDNVVLSMFEDSQKRLWACTANGLNLWLGDDRFQTFSTLDGLPNDVIYGMLEDNEGNLWISTNGGLAKIHQKDGQWHIQSFDVNDGLQANEFNQYAFFKTQLGLLCFGGPNGLTYFDPSQIQPYPYPPEVVITDFQIFNKSQKTGQDLPAAINETTVLHLAHHQNYLSFTFAALGYTQSEQNEYAYQLLGIDDDWVSAGQRRYASYPNLPSGKYTFRVKAANHDGVWNEQAKSIDIHIRAPWWQRWWAYGLYLLSIATITWLFFRMRLNAIRNIEKAKQEERERFRKKTARDFHDEAGNKITKMALLTALIKRQTTDSLQPQLTQLEGHIQSLRSGMRDFIWVLDPENDNLYDTVSQLKVFGQDLFQYTSITFNSPSLTEDWQQVPLSGLIRRHLLLLFKEAMHNVVKHADASQVNLNVIQHTSKLTLQLEDNGRGVNKSSPTAGNGLNNMHNRARQMNGRLEVQDHPEGGTIVTLKLPFSNA